MFTSKAQSGVLSAPADTLFGMERERLRDLHELAARQRGIVTRAQLLEAGTSSDLIKSRVRLGNWQRVYPGVYAAFSGEVSREGQVWAAVLYAGPGASASHRTAAELWGLVDEPSSLIHVTIPGDRRVRKQPGIVLHLSSRANRAVHPSGLPPRTKLEETVLDLWAAARDLDAAVGWVTRALGRRLTTQARLREALQARSRVHWRAELTELLNPDSAGIHSVLEYRYVRDVERPHRFPAATRQAQSRRNGRNLYRDTLYEAYKTAVELDGRVAHPGDARWDDIHRDNAAATAGLRTLRYSWRDVTVTPCRVAAEIAAVLSDHGYTGAHPCSADCPVGRGPAEAQTPSPTRPGQRAVIRRSVPVRAGRRTTRGPAHAGCAAGVTVA
jgi:hypothetical protein